MSANLKIEKCGHCDKWEIPDGKLHLVPKDRRSTVCNCRKDESAKAPARSRENLPLSPDSKLMLAVTVAAIVGIAFGVLVGRELMRWEIQASLRGFIGR